jgi:glycosyltransferase A (GT-A) superfamily protein (DUF2064 family)
VSYKKTKAVLIFAASLFEDLERRKFQKKFSSLLQIPSLDTSLAVRADVHIFTTDSGYDEASSSCEIPEFIHLQRGRTFGERLSNGIDELSDLGYQEIVIIGRDCPDLEVADIDVAFDRLANFRLVLGPDHRGGCYLIAIHSMDSHKLRGVKWQKNTDSVQLQNIFGAGATFLLPVKHDIDSAVDIELLAQTNGKSGFLARVLLRGFRPNTRQTNEILSYIYLPIDHQRSFWQLPPPSAN